MSLNSHKFLPSLKLNLLFTLSWSAFCFVFFLIFYRTVSGRNSGVIFKDYCLLSREQRVLRVLPAQGDSTRDFPPATSSLLACLPNRDHSPDSHPTTCLWEYRKSGVYKPDFFSLLCIVKWRPKPFPLQQNQQGGNTCSNYLKQAGIKGCCLSSHAV